VFFVSCDCDHISNAPTLSFWCTHVLSLHAAICLVL
jgi:hypothetical protein